MTDGLALVELNVGMTSDAGYPYVCHFVLANGNVECVRVPTLPRVRALIADLQPCVVNVWGDTEDECLAISAGLVGRTH